MRNELHYKETLQLNLRGGGGEVGGDDGNEGGGGK